MTAVTAVTGETEGRRSGTGAGAGAGSASGAETEPGPQGEAVTGSSTGTSAGGASGPGSRPDEKTRPEGGHGSSGDGERAPGDGENGPADRASRAAPRTEGGRETGAPEDGDGEQWDDGLIARRAVDPSELAGEDGSLVGDERHVPIGGPYAAPLRGRLDALRELVGLSRTRLDEKALAEAGRVLDEAAARQQLSARHTVVAIAGATGSGKSTLFNALAGVPISETGLRRPTTSAPISLSWSEGAAGLLDRLAIPPRLRRRPLAGGSGDEALQGL
ncbi:GTPase, partial [Streptomyces wuyuanensis]